MIIAALLAVSAPVPADPKVFGANEPLGSAELAAHRGGFVGHSLSDEGSRRLLGEQSIVQFMSQASVIRQQLDNWFNDVATPLIDANLR